MKNKIFLLLLIILVSQNVFAQLRKDRICSSNRHVEECNQLKRGNSEVTCIYAQDAVECAQRIMNGTADFGVFTAENAYHIASMGWEGLNVIKEVRHMERSREPFDYQSVVIVRAEHTGGIENLRGTDFCHPGLHYGRHTRWSERFLKTFERTIIQAKCSFDKLSVAEHEIAGLSSFFNAGCRPGSWSNVADEDAKLKEKYTNLCSLCGNPINCTYDDAAPSSGHQGALDCLTKSTNAITYVAFQEAQIYFSANPDLSSQFSFLCPNGSKQTINGNASPCVWLSQPWKLIVAGNERTVSLRMNLERWTSGGSATWEGALRQMIMPDSSMLSAVSAIVSLRDYIPQRRAIPIGIENCPHPIRWCTRSEGEREKCEVIKMGAATTGIRPQITCNAPRSDAVTCLSEVSGGRADFVGVDSNFGYIARNPNNLSSILFEETEPEKYSSVVVLIKEKDVDDFKRFEDLRGKKACFPEFGGIASIAFISLAKNRGMFKREECEFGPLLGGFFGDSCLPGSRSSFHDKTGRNPDSLCSLCQTKAVQLPLVPLKASADADDVEYEEENTAGTPEGADESSTPIPFIPNRSIDCSAQSTNRYYGTRGSLSCLNEMGDVAVIEHQNLAQHASALNLNPDDFRILCRNGSLAAFPGFDVDAACFLTTIVDGEVLVNRNSDRATTVVNVLVSLDKYFQNDPDFKMYNIFANETNLLFEDSAVGLIAPNNPAIGESVQNYIQLFNDVENCMNETDAANSIVVNLLLTISLVIFTIFVKN